MTKLLSRKQTKVPDQPTGSKPGFTVTTKVQFRTAQKGRKRLTKAASKPRPTPALVVPRAARLLALAHHFQGLIRTDTVVDMADIGRLTGLSRARVTQIMNLLLLAPDIQEALLFLPPVASESAAVSERRLRELVSIPEWKEQRILWNNVNRK